MAFAGYINSWRIHRGYKSYEEERPGMIGMLAHNTIISKECYFLVKVKKNKIKNVCIPEEEQVLLPAVGHSK